MFNEKEKLKILADAIKIRTENDNEAKLAKYFQELLKKYGIESKLVHYNPQRASLVCDLDGSMGSGKMLVVSGHLDVVTAGDESEWTYTPFGGEIHDGKMYGRGTTDMKAGLCALIIAMIELKEEGANFKGKIRLAATVGEEVGMYGSKQLVEEGYIDGADGFLIAEPSSSNRIINAHKGSLQYEIIATGKPAHSSMPEIGIDSIQLMVDYINETNKRFAKAFNEAENKQLGKTLNVNTVIDGGTQINSVAGKTILKANARCVPEVNNDKVVEIIEEVISDLNSKNQGKLELNILQNNPNAVSEKDNDLVKAILNSLDKKIPVEALAGATDASNFGRISDKYDLAIFGPGEASVAHIIDEFVEVDDYLKFIDVYKNTIKNYLV